jgi:hypothetical protein
VASTKPGTLPQSKRLPFEFVSHHAATLSLRLQRVCKLDFAVGTGLGFTNDVEDIRGENITSDDCKV